MQKILNYMLRNNCNLSQNKIKKMIAIKIFLYQKVIKREVIKYIFYKLLIFDNLVKLFNLHFCVPKHYTSNDAICKTHQYKGLKNL